MVLIYACTRIQPQHPITIQILQAPILAEEKEACLGVWINLCKPCTLLYGMIQYSKPWNSIAKYDLNP